VPACRHKRRVREGNWTSPTQAHVPGPPSSISFALPQIDQFDWVTSGKAPTLKIVSVCAVIRKLLLTKSATHRSGLLNAIVRVSILKPSEVPYADNGEAAFREATVNAP